MTFTGTQPARAPRAAFRLGHALQATLESASSSFLTFFLLALLLYALPSLVVALLLGPADPLSTGPSGGLGAVRLGVDSFVTFATSVILQAAMARGVVTHLSGGRASFAQCLRPALAVFLPLLAISFLASVGAMVGLMLLILPGVFLLLMWSVVAPVEVVERTPVLAAFSRSAQLTHGHRWAILAIFLVVWVIALAIQMLSTVVVQMLGLSGAGATGIWIAGAVVQVVGGALGIVFTGAAPGAVYYELRHAKEGALPEELAAVFD